MRDLRASGVLEPNAFIFARVEFAFGWWTRPNTAHSRTQSPGLGPTPIILLSDRQQMVECLAKRI